NLATTVGAHDLGEWRDISLTLSVNRNSIRRIVNRGVTVLAGVHRARPTGAFHHRHRPTVADGAARPSLLPSFTRSVH
ncbi:MAG: hypothetical protein M3R15_06470, partial [Acidobacteriota bacterium]|nr:hypothetical protein [Acidobacteriota bacterium]